MPLTAAENLDLLYEARFKTKQQVFDLPSLASFTASQRVRDLIAEAQDLVRSLAASPP